MLFHRELGFHTAATRLRSKLDLRSVDEASGDSTVCSRRERMRFRFMVVVSAQCDGERGLVCIVW